jgi:hypothetical protein
MLQMARRLIRRVIAYITPTAWLVRYAGLRFQVTAASGRANCFFNFNRIGVRLMA